jgi:hypothetical protein
LPVVYLKTLLVAETKYEWCLLNASERIRKKATWPILGHYPGIFLKGLAKTTESFVRLVGLRLIIGPRTPPPPHYEAGVITTGTNVR